MNKLVGFAVSVLGAAVLAGCGGDDDGGDTVAAGIDEVVRLVLADAEPEVAPGQVLELTRVVIPDGEALAPHNHPGPQLAIVTQGTVTYTVVDGEATVTRDAGTDGATVESYGSGDTFDIEAGDSIEEPAGMVHQARNESGEAVVIYLASLFQEGEPAATPR